MFRQTDSAVKQQEETGRQHNARHRQNQHTAQLQRLSGDSGLTRVQLTAAPQQHHCQQDAQQTGTDGNAQRGAGCLPQHRLLQHGNHIQIEAIHHHREQWREHQQQRQRNQYDVRYPAPPAILRVTPSAHLMATHRDRFAQTLAEQHQPQTAEHLNHRQDRRTARIVVKTERLINREFNGCCLWPAPQRQHRRKAGETEHEDQRGNRWDLAAQPRPFDKTEERPAAHTKLCGELALFTGNIFQCL
ncbi:hypothetical protein D3C80_1056630 [compost metagenome]